MMLSSGGEYGDTSRCRELGISAYLTKPVKQSDLFDSICRLVEDSVTAAADEPAPVTVPSLSASSRKTLFSARGLISSRVILPSLLESMKLKARSPVGKFGSFAAANAPADAVIPTAPANRIALIIMVIILSREDRLPDS